jgi:hypothetical protein
MKKNSVVNYFGIVIVLFGITLFYGCNENIDDEDILTDEQAKTKIAAIESGAININDLFEKYGLDIKSHIWNDYMPTIGEKPFVFQNSQFTIKINSSIKLPSIEVFAKIITSEKTIFVLLREFAEDNIYGKDFRKANKILLRNGEEYTIEITVKILGERQTIVFENQIVDETS